MSLSHETVGIEVDDRESEEILIGQVARGLCIRPKLVADRVKLAYENVTAQQFPRDLAFFV